MPPFEFDKSWIRPPLVDVWYLSGPTASGKSELGLELAERLNAEIASLDSMAVYRRMDIGTAKPSHAARQRVPHHLIDLVEPTESFSVSQYVQEAHRVVEECRARGRQVLFVGGTPLYLKSLLRGMFLGPPADWEFRRQVEEDVAQYGLDALRKRLEQVDPLSAAKILPGDLRRMTRALEVARATGQPLSHWQTQFERPIPREQCRVFVISRSRAALHVRVAQRVEQMFAAGLVEEVQGLLRDYQSLGHTARQAVGYKEVISYLQQETTLDETIELVKAHTRQFVRRQEIWFRSLGEVRRIAMDESSVIADCVDQILEGRSAS